MLELEKRKQRFMEAQQKRRQQLEKKRLEQESKKSKQRDEIRYAFSALMVINYFLRCYV